MYIYLSYIFYFYFLGCRHNMVKCTDTVIWQPKSSSKITLFYLIFFPRGVLLQWLHTVVSSLPEQSWSSSDQKRFSVGSKYERDHDRVALLWCNCTQAFSRLSCGSAKHQGNFNQWCFFWRNQLGRCKSQQQSSIWMFSYHEYNASYSVPHPLPSKM